MYDHNPSYIHKCSFVGELIGIEYLYSQNEKVMEDYMKAIEIIETNETSDSVVETDEEMLEETDPAWSTEDPTISTTGLKLMELKEDAHEESPSATATTEKRQILKIPTEEEYQAMLSKTAAELISTAAPIEMVNQEILSSAPSETGNQETMEVGRYSDIRFFLFLTMKNHQLINWF